MNLSVQAFTCGHLEGDFGRVMEGGTGEIVMPVPVFLIEHSKGRALFDTGLHPDCQHDPAGRLGERMASLYNIRFSPGEEVSARLEAVGRDPARIDLIINSHFHFDHVGGNALIPNATMIVQRREWEARLNADFATAHGFNPADFDVGHRLKLIDGEHDVFGDGSVVCMPTPGHTPGPPVTAPSAGWRRDGIGGRCLLLLPNPQGTASAPLCLRSRGDAGVTRSLASSRSEWRAHHLRSRPRILANDPAGSGADPLAWSRELACGLVF